MADGKRLKPTIGDVGRLAGVSQTTVSYVLSGSPHAERISVDTRERILRAARELGYARNSIGVALQRGYSDMVVVLPVGWELAAAYSRVVMAICRAAVVEGLSAIVHVADSDEEAALFLDRLPSLNPYGLLLIWDSGVGAAIGVGDPSYSRGVPVERLAELKSQGLPIVDLMALGIEGVSNVTSDREGGSYLVARHLIELGHRRIGIILDTVSRQKTGERKLAGCRRALAEAGLDLGDSLVVSVESTVFESGDSGMRRLILSRPDVTAVMCMSDQMALGAIAAAREIGLSVPGDISIAGHGGSHEGGYHQPGLTTVAVADSRMPEMSIEELVRLRRSPDGIPAQIREPMELVVRESTGPAPKTRAPLPLVQPVS